LFIFFLASLKFAGCHQPTTVFHIFIVKSNIKFKVSFHFRINIPIIYCTVYIFFRFWVEGKKKKKIQIYCCYMQINNNIMIASRAILFGKYFFYALQISNKYEKKKKKTITWCEYVFEHLCVCLEYAIEYCCAEKGQKHSNIYWMFAYTFLPVNHNPVDIDFVKLLEKNHLRILNWGKFITFFFSFVVLHC
jgi:hypothetical protein